MNVKGSLNFIYDEKVITESFKKREFILEIPGKYPQYVKFECLQGQCSLLDNFQQGQNVDVEFDLNGKIAKNKEGVNVCYNQLKCWKISASQ